MNCSFLFNLNDKSLPIKTLKGQILEAGVPDIEAGNLDEDIDTNGKKELIYDE